MFRKPYIIVVLLFSLLLQSQTSVVVKIEGIVEVGQDNKVVLVVNPDSRSRIIYSVNSELHEKLSKYKNATLWIKGVVTGETSPWTKELEVISYQPICIYPVYSKKTLKL